MCCECCDCCCCCLGKERDISIAGIVLNTLAIAFLIWGLAELVWSKNGARALYIIAFVLLILTLFGFITILILTLVRKDDNALQLNNISKYISITIIALLAVSLVFFIIAEIVTLVDYIDAEDWLNEIDAHLPTGWWLALIIPGIVDIILISVLLCTASRLSKIFYDMTKPIVGQNVTQVPIVNPINNNPYGLNNQMNPNNPNMITPNTPNGNFITQKALV